MRYTCQACQRGEHKFCAGKNPPPPGMFGGRECICEGDCKPGSAKKDEAVAAMEAEFARRGEADDVS